MATNETDSERRSIEELRKALEATRNELAAAKAAAEGWAKGIEAADERVKALAEEQKKLTDAVSKGEAAQAKGAATAKDLVARAFGGGEFAEKLRKIGEGFKVAGDGQQTFATRISAGASSAVLAVGSLANLGSQAAQSAQQLLDMAVQAEAARLATERLNNSARAVGPAFAAIQEATHGAIDETEALNLRNQALAAGLDTSSQSLVTMAQLVRRYANENVTDAATATAALTQALQTGSREGLARFGLESVTAATAQGRLAEANRLVSQSTDGFMRTERTAAEEMERRQRVMQAAPGHLAQAATTYVGLLRLVRAGYEAYAESAASSAEAERRHASAQENAGAQMRAARAATEAQARAMGELARQSAAASQALKQATTDTALFAAESREGETTAQRLARRMAGLRGLVQQDQLNRMENRGMLAQLRSEGATAEQLRIARERLGIQDTTSQQNQSAQQAKEADRQRAEALRNARQLELEIADIARNRGESEIRYHERVAAYVQRTIAAYQETITLLDRGLTPVVNSLTRNTALDADLRALSGAGGISGEAQQQIEAAAADRSRERMRAEAQRNARSQYRARETELQDNPTGVDTTNRLAAIRSEIEALDRSFGDVQRRIAEAGGDTDANRAELESLQARIAAAQEYQGHLRDLTQAQRENADVSLQMTRAVSSSLQLQTTSAQQWGSFTSGAVNTVTGAFKQHFQALITGKETAGEALKGMLADTLASVASEAAVRAIFMTATGIAQLATYQYAQAAQSFTSAALFGVVAAGAGAATYGLSKATGSSAAASSPSPSGGSPFGTVGGQSSKSEQPASIVINFSSANVIDTKDTINRHLVNALREANRRGLAQQ